MDFPRIFFFTLPVGRKCPNLPSGSPGRPFCEPFSMRRSKGASRRSLWKTRLPGYPMTQSRSWSWSGRYWTIKVTRPCSRLPSAVKGNPLRIMTGSWGKRAFLYSSGVYWITIGGRLPVACRYLTISMRCSRVSTIKQGNECNPPRPVGNANNAES